MAWAALRVGPCGSSLQVHSDLRCLRPARRHRSVQVEAVELHDLHPGRHEVVDELLPGVVARVDLGQRPELGVGAEDQVHRGGGPLQLAGGDVADLVDVLLRLRRLPLGARGEQVDEEVVRQDLWPVGEDAVGGTAELVPRARMPPTSAVISGAERSSRYALSSRRVSGWSFSPGRT